MRKRCFTIGEISGAVWCDPLHFPEFTVLPYSYYDSSRACPEAMLEFRCFPEFQAGEACEIRFSAGCRFRLWINGEFVEDGPVEVGGDYGKQTPPDWWFADRREISRYLKNGRNEFLFQLFPAGITQTDYSLGFGWLWCEFLRKGRSWKSLPFSAWECRRNRAYLGRGRYDAGNEGVGNWYPCVEQKVPVPISFLDLPPLTNRRLRNFRFRFPFGKTVFLRGRTVVVPPGDPVSFLLEFPKETAAHFELLAEGNSPVRILLEFQEICGVRSSGEEVRTGGGTMCFRTVKVHPFRFVQITVEPSSLSSPPDADGVRLRFQAFERRFPLRKKEIPIRRTSAWIRKVDEQCLNNLFLCMQRMHWDSPVHQEGLGCTGDYRIAARIEYAAFGETRLAAADLIRTALLLRQQGKLFHTTYEGSYLFMLEEFLMFSGDRSFGRSLYDTTRIIVRHFESFTGPTGLLSEAENYLFIDWCSEDGVSWHHPPANRGTGAMTAFWYGMLDALVRIATFLGYTEDAEKYRRQAETVRTAFNRELWDDEQKLYLDGIPGLSSRTPNKWLPAEDGKRVGSSLTNILALAYGIPEERHAPRELLERVVKGRLPLSPGPYFMEYLFEAVDRYGEWARWGDLLFKRWKSFEKNGLREGWLGGDYSHVWGGSPSFWRRVLQIRSQTSRGKKIPSETRLLRLLPERTE